MYCGGYQKAGEFIKFWFKLLLSKAFQKFSRKVKLRKGICYGLEFNLYSLGCAYYYDQKKRIALQVVTFCDLLSRSEKPIAFLSVFCLSRTLN